MLPNGAAEESGYVKFPEQDQQTNHLRAAMRSLKSSCSSVQGEGISGSTALLLAGIKKPYGPKGP